MPFTFGGDYISKENCDSKQHKPVVIKKEKRKKSFITIIMNLSLDENNKKLLAKDLKTHFACGGTIKNDTIELQSDKIQDIKAFLLKKGIKVS